MNLVSIIISASDAQESIIRTVKSILCQKHGNFEVIVLSRDGFNYKKFLASKEIDDARIKFMFCANRESEQARVNAVDEAQGQYICFFNAGDKMYPFRLAKMTKALGNPSVVVDNFIVINALSGDIIEEGIPKKEYGGRFGRKDVEELTYPLSLIMSRDLVNSLRYDGMLGGSEFEMNVNAVRYSENVVYINELLHEKYLR